MGGSGRELLGRRKIETGNRSQDPSEVVGFVPDAHEVGILVGEELPHRLGVVNSRAHVGLRAVIDPCRLAERHVPVEVLWESELGTELGFDRVQQLGDRRA